MVTALDPAILALNQYGLPSVLLWLLTLAVTYGILSHVNIPKSMTVRGVIAITVSFLVLLASAPLVGFVTSLVSAAVLISFGLLIAVMFFEVAGAKAENRHIFALHPKFFGLALLIILVLIFIGAGGLGIIKIPAFNISSPVLALIFFLAVMIVAVWVLFKEAGGKKD